MHFANFMHLAAVVQNSLACRRLARIDVRNDANVTRQRQTDAAALSFLLGNRAPCSALLVLAHCFHHFSSGDSERFQSLGTFRPSATPTQEVSYVIRSPSLPAVVCKCLVSLCHLMRVVALLDRRALATVCINNFIRQCSTHRNALTISSKLN